MEIAQRLAKDVLVILFRAFPGHFVLVGGGALHWIFHSPRLSLDIDLKPLHPKQKNLLRRMADTLTEKLSSVAVSLGVAIVCQADDEAQAVRILVDGHSVLHVELASLTPVGGKEKHLLQSESLQSEIIVTPDIHQLLFAKAAALLKRPHLKGRDIFDIWFLQSRGAVLHAGRFSDWLKWEEIESEDIEQKLKQITPSRLRADLDRFLPESIRDSLSEDNYQTLIAAARKLLEPFL
jgi:predicted nucleotidyltransferase component of viral defense system